MARAVFIGEDAVGNLAVDLPFEAAIAKSFTVTTAFHFETLDQKDKLALKLSTDVLNATDAPVTAEIEFIDLDISAVSEANYKRDPEEALPTYRFTVAPQSKETLMIEIPVVQEGIFRHDRRRYSRRAGIPPSYSYLISAHHYKFKDDIDSAVPISHLIHARKFDEARFTAIELTRETEVDRRVKREELFTFKNLSPSPMDMTFTYRESGGTVELLETSIPTVAKRPLTWILNIPGHSDLELKVKTRAPY